MRDISKETGEDKTKLKMIKIRVGVDGGHEPAHNQVVSAVDFYSTLNTFKNPYIIVVYVACLFVQSLLNGFVFSHKA